MLGHDIYKTDDGRDNAIIKEYKEYLKKFLYDKEILDCAKKIKQHCINTDCKFCIFRNYNKCVFAEFNPLDWELEIDINK